VLVGRFKVVLDANVLFSFTLRDTLLRAAGQEYFQVYWSETILEETTRNLVATGTISLEQANRLRDAMTAAFPEAMVTDFDHLIHAMPNQEKDRHVAAAAEKVGAQVIVTNNLRDFEALPEGIEAQSPDEFLSNLFDLDLDRDGMVSLLREQAKALRNPPRTLAELIAGLAKTVPDFAAEVAEYAGIVLP
jgi:predicted nucleic acid-binding protein